MAVQIFFKKKVQFRFARTLNSIYFYGYFYDEKTNFKLIIKTRKVMIFEREKLHEK